MSNSSNQPTIRELVKSVTADTQQLMKAQSELLKTEIQQTQKGVGKTAGMLIGAAAVGGMGAIFLLVTIAYVLVALGLPVWAGFGIVTLVLLIVAAILGIVGKKNAKEIQGIDGAKVEWQRTTQMLSGKEPEKLPAPRASDAVAARAGDVRNAAQ